ncbi:MAG: ABC transporter ATP-binding protein [Thiotrichales bacterium]
MIELSAVNKIFSQGRPNEFHAIRDVSLRLGDERVVVLKGPSGSGKTTLLSLIGCLTRPTSGRVTLDGQMLSGLPERFMTEVRRRTFGFVFQRFNLIRGLSVLENVMLPAYPLGGDHRAVIAAAHDLLVRFHLGPKANERIDWLSGGEAQRVAICRALINDPRVLIADEPTANLDSQLAEAFMTHISELADNGRTVLLSSHDPMVFGAPLVDRVVEMHDGRVVDPGRYS